MEAEGDIRVWMRMMMHVVLPREDIFKSHTSIAYLPIWDICRDKEWLDIDMPHRDARRIELPLTNRQLYVYCIEVYRLREFITLDLGLYPEMYPNSKLVIAC